MDKNSSNQNTYEYAHNDTSSPERESRTYALNRFCFSEEILNIRRGAFERGIPVSSDETLGFLDVCVKMAKPKKILEIGNVNEKNLVLVIWRRLPHREHIITSQSIPFVGNVIRWSFVFDRVFDLSWSTISSTLSRKIDAFSWCSLILLISFSTNSNIVWIVSEAS